MTKPTKYRNRRCTDAEENVFDSAKQCKRWGELKLLECEGLIKDLSMDKEQCTFELKVNGHLICNYIADATYREYGLGVVEDTKSEITRKNPVYRIKYKLMSALYGIEIREV